MTLSFETSVLGVVFGLISNVVAELLLVFEQRRPFAQLSGTHKRLRLIRWLVCVIGFVLVGLFHPSLLKLLLLALFSVSAATDFETSFLPPDWFVYGSTAVSLWVGYATAGISGLRNAVVAQAMCFAVMVFAVLLANAADSGDIKLLMQYGAACGSLAAVGIAISVEVVVRLGVMIALFALAWTSQRNISSALSSVAKVRAPHGPIAWVGLMGMLMISAASTS